LSELLFFHGSIVASPSCTFSAIGSAFNATPVIESMFSLSCSLFFESMLLSAWLLRPFRALFIIVYYFHKALPYANVFRPFRALLI